MKSNKKIEKWKIIDWEDVYIDIDFETLITKQNKVSLCYAKQFLKTINALHEKKIKDITTLYELKKDYPVFLVHDDIAIVLPPIRGG